MKMYLTYAKVVIIMFNGIDKSSPVPVYYQIKKEIEDRINNGSFKPMEKIPSEDSLADVFNVSRMTIRKAIDKLVDQGLLIRKHGAGTFVSKSNYIFKNDLSKLTSSTKEMNEYGRQIKTEVLEKEIVNATKEIANILDIKEGDKVFKYVRLRFINKTPFYLETSYLHFDKCLQLIKEDIAGSVFDILENKYGIKIHDATASIEAVRANGLVSDILNVSEGAPILKIKQTTFTCEGEPVQYAVIISRSDKYKYHIHRRK